MDDRASEEERAALEQAPGERFGGFSRSVEPARIGERVEVDDAPAHGGSGARTPQRCRPFCRTDPRDLARRVSRVNAFGLEFSNVGKNGHSARFAWNGED